jgi:hypothetical protein
VDRAWQAPFSVSEKVFWNPKVRATVCVNSQAARSVLPFQRKRTEFPLAGLSKTEIMTRMQAALRAKARSA